MKYKVTVTGEYTQEYIIEAENEQEVEEKMSDGDYIKEGDMEYINEQIDCIEKIDNDEVDDSDN